MKFIDFVKKHLFLCIALLFMIIILTVGIIFVKKVFFSSSGNEFGNRIDDISNYQISKDNYSNIENELKSDEIVSDVSHNLVGRRLDFIITVNDKATVQLAKDLGGKILSNFSDDIKGYYDIELMIKSENSESTDFPIIGYKHKTSSEFVW